MSGRFWVSGFYEQNLKEKRWTSAILECPRICLGGCQDDRVLKAKLHPRERVLGGRFVEFLHQKQAKDMEVLFEAALRLWAALKRKERTVSVK